MQLHATTYRYERCDITKGTDSFDRIYSQESA